MHKEKGVGREKLRKLLGGIPAQISLPTEGNLAQALWLSTCPHSCWQHFYCAGVFEKAEAVNEKPGYAMTVL